MNRENTLREIHQCRESCSRTKEKAMIMAYDMFREHLEEIFDDDIHALIAVMATGQLPVPNHIQDLAQAAEAVGEAGVKFDDARHLPRAPDQEPSMAV